MVQSTSNIESSFKFLNFHPHLKMSRFMKAQNVEQDGIACNGKLIAAQVKSTAAIALFPTDKVTQFSPAMRLIKGHLGNIFDMQFSPFSDILATVADDGNLNCWLLEDYTEGIGDDHLTEPDLQYNAHQKKCYSVQWHPQAENLLATTAFDKTVKVWDVEEGNPDPRFQYVNKDISPCMRWSPDGRLIACGHKNKHSSVIDIRNPQETLYFPTMEGPRVQRLDWIDDSTLLINGFGKQQARMWGVWDIRNTEQPLATAPLPDGSGIPYFTYDRELSIMYMHAHGEVQLGVYSFDRTREDMIKHLYTNVQQSLTEAFCVMPKQCVDTTVQEVRRAVRISEDENLTILSMRIPNKGGTFSEDFYPPFDANESSNTVDDWCNGVDKPSKKMQVQQTKKAQPKAGGGLKGLKNRKNNQAAPAQEESKGGDNSAEIEALKAQVASLEQELASAKAAQGGAEAVQEDFSTRPELGYWAIRGLAHQIRYMFYYAGVDFEDKMYPCGDAPDFDRSSWTDVKHTLGMEYPNLPYLIDGETKISETMVIMQYIAKKWRPELLGKTSAEMGRVNMIAAQVHSLKMMATGPCYGHGDADQIIESCRAPLQKLVEVMGDNDWLAGPNLTWVDFYFAELVELLDAISTGGFKGEFPQLEGYCDRFFKLPNLAEAWADDSKLMKAPYNNKMAKLLNE